MITNKTAQLTYDKQLTNVKQTSFFYSKIKGSILLPVVDLSSFDSGEFYIKGKGGGGWNSFSHYYPCFLLEILQLRLQRSSSQLSTET